MFETQPRYLLIGFDERLTKNMRRLENRMQPNCHDERPDRLEEACAVFGVYAPGEDVARLTCFGLQALQHRGQESAGIAVGGF